MLNRLTGFMTDVRGEFGRVIWPTRDELVNSTTVVVVFSIAVAVFIGIFDLVLSYVRSILIAL
jgi:preprotein translocase subunit SecE